MWGTKILKKMAILKIIKAGNKKFNGKTLTLNNEHSVATIGRTEYSVDFGTHQPNKHKGDYKVVDCTLINAEIITLYKNSNSSGIHIYKFNNQ